MVKVRKLMEEGHQDLVMEMFLKSPQLGDYTTPEYSLGKINPSVKWEICRSISPAFGYNWTDNDENSLSSEELIKMFIKIVADNGNLLLVINPDGSGKLSYVQRSRLKALGEWLKINGEGIYSTRPWVRQHDETITHFTQSKDGKYVYVHVTEWPGSILDIRDLTPLKGSEITMLGVQNPLHWESNGSDLRINIPDALQNEENRPSKYAWVVKVQVK
ncbi:MAG: alpha-L-fucosidase [Bacteroidales bacterium]